MYHSLLESANHLSDLNLTRILRNRNYGGSKIDNLDYWALEERTVMMCGRALDSQKSSLVALGGWELGG